MRDPKAVSERDSRLYAAILTELTELENQDREYAKRRTQLRARRDVVRAELVERLAEDDVAEFDPATEAATLDLDAQVMVFRAKKEEELDKE